MDPDICYQKIKNLIEELNEHGASRYDQTLYDLSHELVSSFEDLDEWIRGGGFLPEEWKQ